MMAQTSGWCVLCMLIAQVFDTEQAVIAEGKSRNPATYAYSKLLSSSHLIQLDRLPAGADLSFSFQIGGTMNSWIVALALVLSSPAALTAQQSKSPVSDVLRQMLPDREKNTVAAFEEMPADKFDYKPTPEQMTFGHLAAHIVSGNEYLCSNVGDVLQPKGEELKGTEGKDKLVAALKKSFEFCQTALAKADDSKMNENITWFDRKPRARVWAFIALPSSWADHYGMAAMYLRLNGLLPPTAKKEKE
jgi:DinB family protein